MKQSEETRFDALVDNKTIGKLLEEEQQAYVEDLLEEHPFDLPPGICWGCHRKPRKPYVFTGYVLPCMFIDRLLVCGRCWHRLYKRQWKLWHATELFHEDVLYRVRDQAITEAKRLSGDIVDDYRVKFAKVAEEYRDLCMMYLDRLREYDAS
jgi:hypothetical protein